MSDQQQALAAQRALIDAFAATLPGQPAQIFETHISCVVVAGGFAYKFKKPVRFDFVDFSSLASRSFYCEEELRLNARLAPDIYLGVATISGTPQVPVADGPGEAVEYAVKMRAFEQSALWSHRLRADLLTAGEVDQLAQRVADFHDNAQVAAADSAWCAPAALQAIADETLDQIAVLLDTGEDRQRLQDLHAWEQAQRARLGPLFAARKAGGAIRECHGDLHSGNILTAGGTVEAFDCIEFNDSLRWIDVMNDVAFTCMDLRFRQRPQLAARFLNRYLEARGDYGGLAVLRYYETHRALIRCKVALLRAAQAGISADEAGACRREGLDYLAFAHDRIAPVRPAILVTHGFSGSGKSTLARRLVEALDAVQLRSDVERKRMHGMQPTEHAGAALYASDVTQDTYRRLHMLAAQVVQAGWTAIVDATFLQAAQREQFRLLAAELGVPFLILDLRAAETAMQARITQRERSEQDASDAGLDVLARQLANHEPLAAEEMPQVVAVDTEAGADEQLIRDIEARLQC